MKDHYQFGKNLTRIMGVLGMSQADLSKRTGLTPAAISQLCAGVRDPSLHTIVRVLQVIPVKFEQLVTMKHAD